MLRIAGAIAISLVGISLALPAQAVRGTRDCRRMTRQIAHYEGVADVAKQRDNEMWRTATIAHVERLQVRRAKMCPQYVAELQEKNAAIRAARATKAFMKMAGKAALRYFTMGAYGGL